MLLSLTYITLCDDFATNFVTMLNFAVQKLATAVNLVKKVKDVQTIKVTTQHFLIFVQIGSIKKFLAVKITQKCSYLEVRNLVESRTTYIWISYCSFLGKPLTYVRRVSTKLNPLFHGIIQILH